MATHCPFRRPAGANGDNGDRRHHNGAGSEPVIGNAALDNADRWPLVGSSPSWRQPMNGCGDGRRAMLGANQVRARPHCLPPFVAGAGSCAADLPPSERWPRCEI